MSIDFSDQDLLVRVRSGDSSAFGDLYAHYSPAAHRAARRIVRDPHVAEDLVSESFARVFSALRGEHGPRGDLYPYLLVTMRNVAASWGRDTARWTPVGDDAAFQPRDARDHVSGADEAPVDQLNVSLTSSAFEKLPPRWRTVLWYLEVEGESASEVGARLGLTDVAIRQLARRAREGLREAYLTAYLGGADTVGAHIPIADLVQMARGKISLRRRAHVEAHLDTCPNCTRMLFEAAEENSTLRALALPFYLGAALAVVGFFHRIPLPGWVHRSHRPVQQGVFAGFAIAAMALTAVAGAVTVGHSGQPVRTGDVGLRTGVLGSTSGKLGKSGASARPLTTASPAATLASTFVPPNDATTSAGNGAVIATAPAASTTTAPTTTVASTTPGPTTAPTTDPTTAPTTAPTSAPTSTIDPTAIPTAVVLPTRPRTAIPTLNPTPRPTAAPTGPPTVTPTASVTLTVTASPTVTPDPTTTPAPTVTTTEPPTTTPPPTTTITAPPVVGTLDVTAGVGVPTGAPGNVAFVITINNGTQNTVGVNFIFTVPPGAQIGTSGAGYTNCYEDGKATKCKNATGQVVFQFNQILGKAGLLNTPLPPGESQTHNIVLYWSNGAASTIFPAFTAPEVDFPKP
jgi:RNA polymerase sigma factor (sigma-70 family)